MLLIGTLLYIGSDFDKKTLISLNGGGAWTRNFRSYSATLPKTAFNFTGTSINMIVFVRQLMIIFTACNKYTMTS